MGALRRGILALLFLGFASAYASTVIGPWVPLFKGIDYSISTNTPGGNGLPNLAVAHSLRLDLTDPDLHFVTTPRATNYLADDNETGGMTVTEFVEATHVQVGVNANRFTPEQYYLPIGTPMNVLGLSINQGDVVSVEDDRANAATIMFDTNNTPTLIATNWPARPTDGEFTAVSGTYPVLLDGKDIARGYVSLADPIHDVNPRTVFGLSADRRYLYLVVIDGRQPGYSNGALDWEAAEWLILLGASDGVNMDGGGSTTLVIQDSTGFPRRLNRSSAVADSGRERTVGSHFGVFAKPLPGFINDVVVVPDDTSARIHWTTTDPASSQVNYATTTTLANSSPIDSALVTQHSATLTGLTPKTGYYFNIVSATSAQTYTSSVFYFTTTNYVTTNELFNLSQGWRFNAANVSATDWTSPSYDDSGWSGPGPALLWVDTRATGPNPNVNPKNTPMPSDPGTGFPYSTYYFRTHFTVSNLVANASLDVSAYLDDGGIFYLNGSEVYRLRMPSGHVSYQTLTSGYPCAGDATCLDDFGIPGDALVAGDNVLAVEVHNYNARSADITFGMSLGLVEPIRRDAKLEASYSKDVLTLTWSDPGMTLQTATNVGGPWTDVPSATTNSYGASVADVNRYFRLRQ